jgi:hypothetical protein
MYVLVSVRVLIQIKYSLIHIRNESIEKKLIFLEVMFVGWSRFFFSLSYSL